MNQTKVFNVSYLLLAAFLWGTSFIAGKFAYELADPILVVQLRLVIAAVLMLPIFIRSCWQIPKALWGRVAFLAFLTFPATFLLQFIGLKYTSAASAATMLGIEPLLLVMLGHWFFNEPAKRHDWALSLLAFVGVVLVVGLGNRAAVSVWGCLLVLASAVVAAIWIHLSRRLLKTVSPQAYTAATIVLGAVLCLPFTLLLTQDWQLRPSASGIAALLYLGIGCSLVAGWAWNKGLLSAPTSVGGIFLALDPVFGVGLAMLLLGERLGATGLLGVLLVLSAAGLSVWIQVGASSAAGGKKTARR